MWAGCGVELPFDTSMVTMVEPSGCSTKAAVPFCPEPFCSVSVIVASCAKATPANASKAIVTTNKSESFFTPESSYDSREYRLHISCGYRQAISEEGALESARTGRPVHAGVQ